MSNWYDNIPKQGVLVKDSDGCLHLVVSISKRRNIITLAHTPSNDIITYVDDLESATIEDWLSLSPASIDCETKTKIFDLINGAKND